MAMTPTDAVQWLHTLADVIDKAIKVYQALPKGVATVKAAKTVIEQSVAHEEGKHVDESALGFCWRWIKKGVTAVGCGVATGFVAVAVGATAIVTVPVGLIAGGVVLAYLATGKTMWTLWNETNASLLKDAAAIRAQQEALQLKAKCPHKITVSMSDADKDTVAAWFANNEKVLSATILVAEGKSATVAATTVGL